MAILPHILLLGGEVRFGIQMPRHPWHIGQEHLVANSICLRPGYGDWQGSNATRYLYRVSCAFGRTSRGPSTGAHRCTMHVGDPQLLGSHHALGRQPPRQGPACATPQGMAHQGGLARTTISQAWQTHCAPLPTYQQLVVQWHHAHQG